MKSLGWALIQYDWCLDEKRKFGHKGKMMKVQGRQLQAQKRGLGQDLPFQPQEEQALMTPPSQTPASSTVRKYIAIA